MAVLIDLWLVCFASLTLDKSEKKLLKIEAKHPQLNQFSPVYNI